MALEDSSNAQHQHYQAIALHMWKVGALQNMVVKCGLQYNLEGNNVSTGGKEAF